VWECAIIVQLEDSTVLSFHVNSCFVSLFDEHVSVVPRNQVIVFLKVGI
jgi:hypothetical protein